MAYANQKQIERLPRAAFFMSYFKRKRNHEEY